MSYPLIAFYILTAILQLVIYRYKGNKISNWFVLFLSLLFYLVFFTIIFEIVNPEHIPDAGEKMSEPQVGFFPRPMVITFFCIPGWFASILTYIVIKKVKDKR